MKSFRHLVLPTLTLLLVSTGVSAQAVYRCGNSYSQTPCAGAVAVPTDDARTDEQRAAAKQALASDKALAKELEASRRKDEAMALAQEKMQLAAAHKKPEAKKASEPKTKKKTADTRTVKVKEPEFFTATDGAKNSKKKTSNKAGKS